MNINFEAWCCLCIIFTVTGYSLAQKYNYDYLRLGRGLSMLRLGKRSADLESVRLGRHVRSLDSQESSRLSSSDIRAVLDSLFVDPRDETRRQPPLPRYGRDSSSSNRFLVDANPDDMGGNLIEYFPISNPRSYFRPAPRGGRYKKSFPMGRITYADCIPSLDEVNRARAIEYPRVEQLSYELGNLQHKMVPRSRLGRTQNDESEDSSQIQSA